MAFGTMPRSLEEVELLSILAEVLLYGFSLLMFCGTIWALLSQRYTRYVNRKMLVVACLLLVVSTVHVVIDIIRIMDGFIIFANATPEGPTGYFINVSEWTFVVRQYVFTVQTLLGDGVVLYRCFVVWQSKLIMVLPLLFWCSVGVTGFGSGYISQRVSTLDSRLSFWLLLFWAFALVTNLLATCLLVLRIWYIDRKARQACGERKSQLQPFLQITVDAGLIYSVFLLVGLVSFVTDTSFPFPVTSPLISITFYMVIIRAGLANRSKHSKQGSGVSLRFSSGGRQGHELRNQAENEAEHGRPIMILGQTGYSEYLDVAKGASLGRLMLAP